MAARKKDFYFLCPITPLLRHSITPYVVIKEVTVGLGLKKGDTALVMTGKSKGKRGRVLAVSPVTERITIESINIIKRHTKPNKKYAQGGIIEKEGPIHMSNVMLVCPKCNEPTRIGNTILDDGKKLRTCSKCKEVFD